MKFNELGEYKLPLQAAEVEAEAEAEVILWLTAWLSWLTTWLSWLTT